MKNNLEQKARAYIDTLCRKIQDRSVGSSGNIEATSFFAHTIAQFGWDVEEDELAAMDWISGGTEVTCGNESFSAHACPYSEGCRAEAGLVVIRDAAQLEVVPITGKILLLTGGIAKEQLMPKNFVFYNPENHRHIISVLEREKPAALICATGRNSALAGGAYPFPLIEDGDFDIPCVFMKDIEGERLAAHAGKPVRVSSDTKRIPSRAYNVTARKGSGGKRIVITAHIDAKKGTPGAIDNATGVASLLLAAELLSEYKGNHALEIIALNGEDYYAVPGQMSFIKKNEGRFGDIALNINIDGAGYHEGYTALSFYGAPDSTKKAFLDAAEETGGAAEGPQWPQGDHSIFAQYGVPAVAITSRWFCDSMETQSVTHTPEDHPGIVNFSRIADIAEIIARAVVSL